MLSVSELLDSSVSFPVLITPLALPLSVVAAAEAATPAEAATAVEAVVAEVVVVTFEAQTNRRQ